MKNIFVRNNADGTQSLTTFSNAIQGVAWGLGVFVTVSVALTVGGAIALFVKEHWGPAGFAVIGGLIAISVISAGVYVMVLERRIKRSNAVVEKLNEARQRELFNQQFNTATTTTYYIPAGATNTQISGGTSFPPIV